MAEFRPSNARQDGNAICIVDDNISVCESLSLLLEIYGFEVLGFPSGADFLADERRWQARFLVIDHHMPRMDGLEVIGVLRSEEISIPSVLITGRLDAGAAERAGRLGVIAILEKPFPIPRLLELIRTGLTEHC